MQAESEASPGSQKPGKHNRVATYGHRRFQFERLRFIEYTITHRQYPNCPALAAELEVCTVTIKRDIEYLRSGLGHDLAFDYVKNGYFYRTPPGQNSLFAPPEEQLRERAHRLSHDAMACPIPMDGRSETVPTAAKKF